MDTEARDQYGATALMGAAAEGHTEVLKLLLDAKANVQAEDRNGWTALMWASSAGLAELVALLKAHGAR